MTKNYYIIDETTGELTEYEMVSEGVFLPVKTIIMGYEENDIPNLVIKNYQNDPLVFEELAPALEKLRQVLLEIAREKVLALQVTGSELMSILHIQWETLTSMEKRNDLRRKSL